MSFPPVDDGKYRLRYPGLTWRESVVDWAKALPVPFGIPAVLFAIWPPDPGMYWGAVGAVGLALLPFGLGIHRWLQGGRLDRQARGRREERWMAGE